MRISEWRQFVDGPVAAIPGWLHTEAALLTAHMSEYQRLHGMKGPMLEIGVFKGKYLSLLYKLSAPSDPVVGVDLFLGADDTERIAREVRDNIAAACGDASRLTIIVSDTMLLTAERIQAESGADKFRLISIDAGHTRELVSHDLEVTTPLLKPGGIMALDDAFNHTTPGVIEGIAEYFFRHRPSLAPFAHCYNKLFVTTPEYHQTYLRETLSFLDALEGLPTRASTLQRRAENRAVGFVPKMFGYEVVPFL